MKRKIKYFLYRNLLPHVGLWIVNVIAMTYRLRLVDSQNERDILDQGKSLIYISWHQRFFPGITFFAKRKPIAIMISQSRDGDIMAHVVKVLGWHPVRGSSSRGGREGLQELKSLALDGYRIGHIVDGPKGPFGVVKPGLLKIAQVSGLPIVPTITSAQKKWCFNSWDRFMIPKFFSRVIIRFGEPIFIPQDMDEDEFETKRRWIEKKLQELYEDTDAIWNDPERIQEIFRSKRTPLNQ
jgi:lysophospholipid acyltransferase (LPLAT)-like uncharacterized protein